MADDFMDLLSGKDLGKKDEGNESKEDLLGSLLGGGGGAAGGLGGLLGTLMGGGGAGDTPGDSGDMADMLGSLLGGGAGASTGAGGLGGLLGGLMGSGGAGGLSGLLGGLMGGNSAEQMSFGGGGSGPSLPFAGTLAKKLGISEQMANALIMGAIGLITSSMAKNRSGGRSGEVDFNALSDPDYIRSSGVAGRLSSQMGISEDEAIVGLQHTMSMLAAGDATAKKPKKAAAKKTTAKKTNAVDKKPATPKKTTANTTKTTPKKKSSAKKESGTDFMDLLDDVTH